MSNQPVNKGDIEVIDLDNIAYGGDAVGRKNNFTIFVPQGIPGEKVKIKITEVKKSYGRGEIISVIEETEERIIPTCEVSEQCGGCQIDHIDYQAQLKYKRQMVEDALEHIGKLEGVDVNPVLGMEHPYSYRNKAQFPVDIIDEEAVIGFYAAGSHDVIAHQDCQIQHPVINRTASRVVELINEYDLSVYNEEIHQGLIRHLVVRIGVCTNQAQLILVTNGQEIPYQEEIIETLMSEIPELISIHQNINTADTNVVLGEKTKELAGEDYIIDYIGNIKYQISPLSFFQINTLQTKVLYDQVLEYAELTGEEKVLDAYCGLGSISLYVAGDSKKVYGIEVVDEAIDLARKNAELNEIENCSFEVGKVRDVLPQLKENFQPEVVIVDPPRKGCHEEVLESFIELKAEKIIYVSCKPTSLARDLKYLTSQGYAVEEVQPVDMFPQTYHIENVVKIVKSDK
ncbi:23S rRNA (uracil(1939)-C(5))-methyltransferase RlmD [Halanaerobacter jeridensis]|uniref:23S rRNA (Uracil1939-C5)-methyltransferase n=1 Tax=Halanaerobacter jeridensis TaxID=706427 RepID=A0A938XVS2_9FIRM|nr:23S rRNA (uracil(1939)-C(5))-methyltransferase RlmD [Halanaerobacter jeridensis]MBM7557734.1 23S rRNA (uracil1939-C5)-methyltransferase [Halanaerobacter jeridensis]